jgi:NAD/NADP transhydrogenase beta subunit
MGGGAAAAIAAVELLRMASGEPGAETHGPVVTALAAAGAFIGGVSFSGSLIAFGKLQGLIKRSFRFKGQQFVNLLITAATIALGATIVNDISGFTYDSALAGVVARTGAAAILMHNRGRSENIYEFAQYTDVMAEIAHELTARLDAAEAAGVSRAQLIVDPGYGFAKRAPHTLAALARLDELASIGRPILSGPSRKSFLKTPLGDVPPAARVWGTAAAVTASILAGAHIIRVHDVTEMVQVARTADAIRDAAGMAG